MLDEIISTRHDLQECLGLQEVLRVKSGKGNTDPIFSGKANMKFPDESSFY